MKQQKIKLYTYASKYSWDKEFKITTASYLPRIDSSASEVIIPLSDIEVEIPVPEVSNETLVNGEIKQIKKTMKEDQRKAFERQKFFEQRISELLSIESK